MLDRSTKHTDPGPKIYHSLKSLSSKKRTISLQGTNNWNLYRPQNDLCSEVNSTLIYPDVLLIFIISVVLDIYSDVSGARKAVLNHGYEITIVLFQYTYCNRLYDFLVS